MEEANEPSMSARHVMSPTARKQLCGMRAIDAEVGCLLPGNVVVGRCARVAKGLGYAAPHQIPIGGLVGEHLRRTVRQRGEPRHVNGVQDFLQVGRTTS